ncbi:MAG: phage portal protein [Phycisphaerales bacterium]
MSRLRDNLAAILQKRFTLKNPPEWFIDYFGGGESASGVKVGHQAALHYTPFWAAVRIISGTLGSLPFKIYKRLDNGGKEPMPGHRLYPLIHERPNDYMDWLTFAETRQAHVLCYGNAYAEIQRDGTGRPIALWPLLPDRTCRKETAEGLPYYEVQLPAGDSVQLADENVLHIKGLGFDGYTGYDVVSYHKDAIGYGIAVKEYGARFYSNDASPGGVLECPTAMSDAAFKRLKESWNEQHTGLSNAHRMQLLEEGTKWTKIGVEPDKAQAIEAQKFTVDDCARIFQIPPHKLQSMEFSKYSNVYDLNSDFYCSTMLYWFRKWEQEINYKLLMPSERGSLFVEILVDALLRGNVEARTAFYASGRQWGYLSINDIRAKENMNPIGPEGDVYLDPLNMAPAGTLTAAPADDPDDPPADGPDPKDDPVRKAHIDLLAGHVRRVLTKQANSCKDRQQSETWWNAHRKWACEVLAGPVVAYAATRGMAEPAAGSILEAKIYEWINNGVPLPESFAEIIAEDIIERIGGHHGDG